MKLGAAFSAIFLASKTFQAEASSPAVAGFEPTTNIQSPVSPLGSSVGISVPFRARLDQTMPSRPSSFSDLTPRLPLTRIPTLAVAT